MFEYIRTHQRLMQFLLLLIIFPSFAFFGIESYTRSRGGEDVVATVAGQSITQQEFDATLRDQLNRFRQMYGPQFDSKMLNTPMARQEILDELIARKAIAAEVARTNLTVTDQTLQQSILATPGLTKPDGSFDVENYKASLAAQGMTPPMYEQRLRQDMVLQQLLNAVQGTSFIPKLVAERLMLINEQEREVSALTFKTASYIPQVKITDEMLKAYYEKNAAQFEIPEQIKAEYVVLSNDALASQTTVSESDIQSFYEQNKKTYSTDEQRRASHILIGVKKEASDAEKSKAKGKAESLLSDLRKNPTTFAKLAKENSQDPGSAERGGDLDFFSKGMMVKSFEDAAYKLKVGEISDVIQSDFGFHIIQLTAVKPAAVKALDEVKSQIIADIQRQKAAKAYKDAAESFGNIAYEQPDSLKPLADKFKLKIETVNSLGKQINPAIPAGVLTNNAKFLKAIFSDEAVKKKHNTEAIEVAPNTLIVGRVLEYKAVSKRPFDEVKSVISTRLTQTEAESLATKDGLAKLAALKAQDATQGFSDLKVVSKAKSQGVSPKALAEILKADTQKLPAFVGVSDGIDSYTIYRIGKVMAGVPDQAARAGELKQIKSIVSQQEAFTYIEALKARSKVTINKPAISTAAVSAP
ncbi:SurA N-terminal domain-containing protein [Undibacterium sp. SXout7W]|uniref:SurA N-terminal domain-containing protein n=1 Tax=Undibacterium sp. SXout7W TaxID=3413049 RepID=UPI003BF36F20